MAKFVGRVVLDSNYSMKKNFGDRAVEFIICCIAFVFCALFFCLITDDYAFFDCGLAAKQFGDFPYFDWYYLGLIGISELYRFTYIHFPTWNWLNISFVIFEFISLYMVLRTIRKVVMKNLTGLFYVRFIQILAAIFFIENIVLISHTRFSLIFCGIGLFNLVFIDSIRKKELVLYSLVFVFGMLIRPESSICMLLLISTGYLIHEFKPGVLAKRVSICVAATILLFGAFTLDWYNTDVFVRKIEPEIEYKMMAKRVVDIGQMKSQADSAKYEAALIGMWFDFKIMTPEFMRSLILPGVDVSYEHIKAVWVHIAGFYRHYIFLNFVLLVFLWLSFLMPSKVVMIQKIVLYQLFTVVLIYALDYNGFLVSNRHFFSIQFISLLVQCFYFFGQTDLTQQLRSSPIHIAGAVMMVLLGIAITFSNYRKENAAIDLRANYMIETMGAFERKYKNRIVVVTNDCRFLFDRHFSLRNEIYTGNTYLMFDLFTFNLIPRYIQYLSEQCKCDASNPVAFFTWLAAKDALYLSAPYRYTTTENYMAAVHGCELSFAPKERINNLTAIPNEDTRDSEVRTIRILSDSTSIKQE